MNEPSASIPFHRGSRVNVRTHFDGSWAAGFEVADTIDDRDGGEQRYRLRRLSDGEVLPVEFPTTEIRPDAG